MSAAKRNEALRGIFRAAFTSDAGTFDPEQYHPVDDDELLIEWSVGDLDERRHRAVLDHLAECSYCRRELADMIQAGALVLPEAVEIEDRIADEDPNPQPTVPLCRERSTLSSKRSLLIAVSVIAASLLVAVIWGLPEQGGVSMVAMAQRDLEAGRHANAMQRMEKYLEENKGLDAKDRTEAGRILEESGYRLALKGLGSGNSDGRKQVLDIEAHAAQHGSGSGRLSSLRIQAHRGANLKLSLSGYPTLPNYGYDENGQHESAFAKSIYADPPKLSSKTEKQIGREFVEAVKKHPDSLDLRLNYGHFLLEQKAFEQAAVQFTAAVKLDPTSVLAQTGLGLVLFQKDTDEDSKDSIEQALAHFRKAVEISPEDHAANLNTAICLTRLGRKAEAKPYFQKAHDVAQQVP